MCGTEGFIVAKKYARLCNERLSIHVFHSCLPTGLTAGFADRHMAATAATRWERASVVRNEQNKNVERKGTDVLKQEN